MEAAKIIVVVEDGVVAGVYTPGGSGANYEVIIADKNALDEGEENPIGPALLLSHAELKTDYPDVFAEIF